MAEKHYGHLAPSYVAQTVRAAFGDLGLIEASSVVPRLRLSKEADKQSIGEEFHIPRSWTDQLERPDATIWLGRASGLPRQARTSFMTRASEHSTSE